MSSPLSFDLMATKNVTPQQNGPQQNSFIFEANVHAKQGKQNAQYMPEMFIFNEFYHLDLITITMIF